VKIIAHRGDSIAFPENTAVAFRSAWAKGADGVELDVQLSADGELVVFHDRDGERLCGQRQRVAACDWQNIQSWRVQGEPVPLLADVLREAPAGVIVLVEIKCGAEALPALKTLALSHSNLQIAVLAFDPEVARTAARGPLPAWLNVEQEHAGRLDELLAFANEMELKGLSLGWSEQISADIIRKVHGAGLGFAVWTVNNPATALRLQAWGADILMTDHPEAIRKVIQHAAPY
jgi:glycerophosphoryl diester phosphodiesterase